MGSMADWKLQKIIREFEDWKIEIIRSKTEKMKKTKHHWAIE